MSTGDLIFFKIFSAGFDKSTPNRYCTGLIQVRDEMAGGDIMAQRIQGLKKDISYVYEGVERDLLEQISSGVLLGGECILSENEISRKYNISRRSARKAIDNLIAQNLLYRVPGKGTFVSEAAGAASPSFSVSYIVPDIEDLFIAEICHGLQDEAVRNRYNLLIQSSNGSIEQENNNIRYLVRNHVQGAIIFPNWGRANVDALFLLKEKRIPFVLVDRYYPDFDTDYVVVDNYGGAHEAVMHLIRLGHRKIAHLYGTAGSANDARLQGYLTALGESGIVYNPAYVRKMGEHVPRVQGDRFEPDTEGGYLGMLELLALPDPPTAVFCGNDYQAIGAMRAIKEAGKKIPDDIALVGFDDLKLSSLIEIPLTTVRQPKNEIGHTAFRILLQKINSSKNKDTSTPFVHEVLKTELVVRKSCGAKN